MKKNILIAAVMLLAFSAVASAQSPAVYTVATIPVTTVSSCGTTELTGDVILSQVANSPVTLPGTFTLNYGVPITSALADIVVTVNGGAAATGLVTVSPTSNLAGGQLVLQLTPGATNLTNIDVTGVRVNVAGSTLTSLDVNVTSTGNAIQGALTARVINSIASSIASVTATPVITINALNPGAVLPATATVTVTEGFFNAFALNSIVGVTFSPVPAGLQLTNFPLTITDAQATVFTLVTTQAGTTPAGASPTLTGANPQVFYKVTTVGANAPANIETLPIQFTVSTTSTAVLPLLPATLPTVSVDMYPKAGVTGSPATPPLFSGTNCQKTSTAPFITISTATSTLLMPYATTVAGYDTGIAIANATNGPTTDTAVTKQSGTITFWLVPADGSTPFSITPTGTTGGLQAGVLPSGGEFVYLLSSLLADAAKPANFSGHIYVVCNFTNAHGQYFISDFEAFTNGALMLVVQTPRSAGAEGLNQ